MSKPAWLKTFPPKPRRRNTILSIFLILVIFIGGLFFHTRTSPKNKNELFVIELTGHFCSDQTVRADLLAISRHQIPAFARLAKIDQAGSWSLIYLGPFPSRPEALSALELLKKHGLYTGEAQVRSEPEIAAESTVNVPGPFVLELAALLNDELVLEALAYPLEAGVYAFARTAEVNGASGEAWNHIYLGPFGDDRQAGEALARLADWDLGHSFTAIPLLGP